MTTGDEEDRDWSRCMLRGSLQMSNNIDTSRMSD